MRLTITFVTGLVLCLLLVLGLGSFAQAEEITFDIALTTTNQSIWSSGAGLTLDKSLFLGYSWESASKTIGGFVGGVTTILPGGCVNLGIFGTHCVEELTVDTTTGLEASVNLDAGRAGIELGFLADAGSVDAAISYDASLNVPDLLNVNDYFSLTPDSIAGTDNYFSTNFGDLSASLDVVLDFKADIGAEACLLGGCIGTEFTLGSDEELRQQLLGFDNGAVTVLGSTYGLPKEIDLGYVEATLNWPSINTSTNIISESGLGSTSLSASGEADVAALTIDLDALITTALGLPPLGGNFAYPDPEANENYSLTLGYNLLDVQAGPVLSLNQDFQLDATLWTTMDFSSPVLVDGQESMSLTSEWSNLPQLALLDTQAVEVTPEFFLETSLTNTTSLGLYGIFEVKGPEFNASFEGWGLDIDLAEFSTGYLYQVSTETLEFPPLFSRTFDLGGFNTIQGQSFILQANGGTYPGGEPIPEPASLLLLGTGLGALGLVAYRHKRK